MTGNPQRPAEISIRLRPVTIADLPVIFRYQLDPEANRMAVVHPRDAATFEAHWTRVLNDPKVTARAILAGDELVGDISSFDVEGRCCVGYWIAREHWGRGIATRALSLLLREVTTRPLHASAASHNHASIRVLTRNGFVIRGHHQAPATERFPACEEALLELA